MGVGIDDALHAFVPGLFPPAPVEIETPGVAVELDHGVVGGAGVDDFGDVELVGLALKEETAAEVAEHGDVRIFHGAENALGHFVLGQLKRVVNAGDDVVQFRQKIVLKVQAAIPQDIDFRTGENPELVSVVRFVQLADVVDLFAQPFFIEAVGLNGGFAVISDAQVLKSQIAGGLGHVFEGILAVAGPGVIVKRAAEIGQLDQLRQVAFLRRFDFATVFAKGGIDVAQAERAVEIGLVVDLWRRGFAAFGGSEAIFVQGESLFEGAAAESDVVFLAAGEVGQSEGVFLIGHGAEIALDAVFQADRGFGGAMNEDFFGPWLFDKEIHEGLRFLRRHDEVEIVDGFLATAHAPGGFSPAGVGMRAETFENLFDQDGHVAEAESPGVTFAVGDSFEDFLHALGSEPGEFGRFARFANVLELFDRIDAQLVVERLDLFAAHAGDVEQLEDGLGEFLSKILPVFHFSVATSWWIFLARASPIPLMSFRLLSLAFWIKSPV